MERRVNVNIGGSVTASAVPTETRSEEPERISLIVTTHNQKSLLPDTLISATRQMPAGQEDQLHVIVVDDGSDEDVEDVIEAFRPVLPRLTLLKNPVARGVSAARNRGLDVARGTYIAFLDGDDWLEPNSLSVRAETMDRLGVDFVRTPIIEENRGTRTVRRLPTGRLGTVENPRDFIMPPNHTTVIDNPWVAAGMYHRRLQEEHGVLRFDESLLTAEDRLWFWRVMLAASSCAFIDGPTTLWRRGISTTLTQIGDERQIHFAYAFGKMADLLNKDRERERLMPKLARQFLAITCFQLERKSRLSKELQHEMYSAIQVTAQKFDQGILLETVKDLGPKRQKLLAPALPAMHQKVEGASFMSALLSFRPSVHFPNSDNAKSKR